MLKSKFTKMPPSKIDYRSYKNFNEKEFNFDLSYEFYGKRVDLSDYDNFETIFISVLDRHAPMKSKIVRGNEKLYMNRKLKKAIMKRSRLWNKFLKSKSSSDYQTYRVQRNLVTKLNKKSKLDLFNSACESQKRTPSLFGNFVNLFFQTKAWLEVIEF